MEINDTAGQAHPYWYEWFVGLIEIVELLNPDAGIESVALQVSSIRVWDDVVVWLKNGRRCYQVKHSRVKDSLAFGDLVQADDQGQSLLGALFAGQKESDLNDGSTKLILYTNRSDGARWSTLSNGKRRPPLLQFWSWLKRELTGCSSFATLSVPDDYKDGWQEWIACLVDAGELESITFLRQLELRTKEDDLDGLEERIRRRLATAFGISLEQAAPLFDALTRALRRWTTGGDPVTAEALCDALIVPPEPKDLAHAPPPPTPFFPTRCSVAEDLERALSDGQERPVIFLTGEPGSGKTSVVSWLANRRTEAAFQGVIGIRFYCFEPIRPGQPFIAADSSRVRPEELWFSLLSQLRRGLEGRLHEFKVPLRNALLDWQDARSHVLRLADLLGRQLGRRFVISIDGIDHAARASQILSDKVAAFFASLPTPDELSRTSIRLLIAGQPPEYYASQYPLWLQGEHPQVRRFDLPTLDGRDIRALLEATPSRLPATVLDECVRLIEDSAKGNTLAVVFAVAEAESADSLEDLKTTLEQKRLTSGVEAYYESIWQHALRNAPTLSCTLSGAISFARRPLTAEQLEAAFPDWRKPLAEWQSILEDLGPLLVAAGNGFTVRHNDVRVFLASRFQGFSEDKKKSVASSLATYFRTGNSDRLSAHLQLWTLLSVADRTAERAETYDVDWVMEGTVLGIEFEQLRTEGREAVESLSTARDWSKAVSVACALQTLSRLSNDADLDSDFDARKSELPPFLPSEASVQPLSKWTRRDFDRLIADAFELLNGGASARALGLLTRWLGGLTLNEIALALADPRARRSGFGGVEAPGLEMMATHDFENLGSLCGTLNFRIEVEEKSSDSRKEQAVLEAFEKGLVRAAASKPQVTSVENLFEVHRPTFVASWELAVRQLADAQSWVMVGQLLKLMTKCALSDSFALEAAWFSLRSGIYKDLPEFLAPLGKKGYCLWSTNENSTYHEPANYDAHLSVCRALGWTRPGFDTLEISDSVLEVFAPFDNFKDKAEFGLLFHASALLGRVLGLAHERGWERTAESISPVRYGQILSSLWTRPWHSGLYQRAAMVGEELVDCASKLGKQFEEAAFEAALPMAEQKVLGLRMKAIWNTVKHSGRIDVLRKWVEHHLGPTSATWSSPNREARETINDLTPFASSLGLDDLVDYASQRATWLRIAYHDRKEYSFEEICRWFHRAAENDPAVWVNHGWKLWQLCFRCREHDGGNEFESEILNSISAAAIRCGSADWWQLISTTLDGASERDWHYRTRECLIAGAISAISQGHQFRERDVLPLWALAVSLSYWFNARETASLRELCESLTGASEDQRKTALREIMLRSVPQPPRDDACEGERQHDAGVACGPTHGRVRNEADFWSQIDSIVPNALKEEREWGLEGKLFEVAFSRACLHGNDALVSGVELQLYMHARWAFGGGEFNQITWKNLPPRDHGVTWESCAVRFQNVLLETYSADVVAAALNGLHLLVDQNPSIISDLFVTIDSEWSRMWLLNAAEPWAVLYPEAVADSRNELQASMARSDLVSRLQAWVVLCRNCDSLNVQRVPFPVADQPALTPEDLDRWDAQLLEVPPTMQGHRIWANRYSAARGLLKYAEVFDFDFSRLEGLIAHNLRERAGVSDHSLKNKGPHRYADYFCTPLDAECAVGDAILQIMSRDWCSQEVLADLCHVFLANEDAWIYRNRPQALRSSDDWPSDSEYGGGEIDATASHKRLLSVATSASVPAGWRVFSAHVADYTWKEEFVLDYWLESVGNSLILAPSNRPTCPGGRSFVWWVGEPFELERPRFVSGLFVGGRSRLFCCQFEIRPTRAWRELFGWEPLQHNPLEWVCDGQQVARYQRLHGQLRDNSHGPNYRQPMIDRWIVTDEAFLHAQRIVGELAARQDFRAAAFHSD